MKKNVRNYINELEQQIERERDIQHRLSDDDNFLKAFFDIKDKLEEVKASIDDNTTVEQLKKTLDTALNVFIDVCKQYNGDKSMIQG